MENAETLEETTPTRAVPLQHDPCDDDEDCGEAVHIKMVWDMAAESDVNVVENNAEAESGEVRSTYIVCTCLFIFVLIKLLFLLKGFC